MLRAWGRGLVGVYGLYLHVLFNVVEYSSCKVVTPRNDSRYPLQRLLFQLVLEDLEERKGLQ